MRYYCKCGMYFGKSMQRAEHIGIGNPRWPRSSPDDEHAAISEAQWQQNKAKQYRILLETPETS